MKHKKVISVAFLLLGLGGLQAQEAVSTTGGEATGNGGTSSYTIGQVAYITNTGGNGVITEGVQQPIEILTVGIDEPSIELELSVFPNPTTNFLTLKVAEFQDLSYQLIDVQGKVIKTQTIIRNSTKINLNNTPKGIYFLKVLSKNKIENTFKIIKN